jgi:DNA-binding NtrC family response regulator
MQGLLIANEDRNARSQLAALFEKDGYQVTTTDSVVNALEGILNKTIQVVVLAGNLDEAKVLKLVPLLKKCNQQLSIILVADEIPLNLLRRIRNEGIFYHALTPAGEEGQDEIYQAVHYAFRNYREHSNIARPASNFGLSLGSGKAILSTLLLLLTLNVPG